MKKISVKSDRQYDVSIDINWRESLAAIAAKYERVLVITPASLAGFLGIRDEVGKYSHLTFFEVPDGESQKNISVVERIWELLGRENFTRSDAIIAIGGGATTDLSGFVAATWLRGVDWFAFPTTLAGMVDASVGGKTGINSPAGKNLIGSFFSPSEVLIDLSFLDSLSDRDFSAGLAEVIKTGFIEDIQILNLLQGVDSISQARMIAEELIQRSIAVKARVVSADFREGKLREILNYGHTLGHAIEKHANYELRHGEAVAIGLVFIAELSAELCDLSGPEVRLHKDLLRKFSLPTSYSATAWPDLLHLMASDKKSRGSRIRFVGLSMLGKPQWIEATDIQLLTEIYGRISA